MGWFRLHSGIRMGSPFYARALLCAGRSHTALIFNPFSVYPEIGPTSELESKIQLATDETILSLPHTEYRRRYREGGILVTCRIALFVCGAFHSASRDSG